MVSKSTANNIEYPAANLSSKWTIYAPPFRSKRSFIIRIQSRIYKNCGAHLSTRSQTNHKINRKQNCDKYLSISLYNRIFVTQCCYNSFTAAKLGLQTINKRFDK